MNTENSVPKRFVLWVLKLSAKIQIYKTKPKIIGVGGSSGKTSLANFIYLILKEKYKVKQSGGKNSESGIPLSILNINMKNYKPWDWFKAIVLSKVRLVFEWKKFDFYIAEMGIDSPIKPGNMDYLLGIIKPDMGVLSNISLEHSENFDSLVKLEKDREEKILELTANQELSLLNSISATGSVILNIDDELINKNKSKIVSKIITVSAKNKDADFYIKNIDSSINSFNLKFAYQNKEFEISLKHPLPDHYAFSLLLSVVVSVVCGLSVKEAVSNLEKNFSLPPGRFSIFNGKKHAIIIDSSYNSAPIPLVDTLNFIRKISGQRRKVVIIGDMRELGSISKKAHEEVASQLLKTTDFAILIGPMMQEYVAPILKKAGFEFAGFNNFTDAKDFILKSVKENDLILVKGSQNTLFLERAVEILLENPKDKGKLCRRGEFWNNKREKTL